jgi:riboflavin kinase/FMN adenylyltransferase
MKINNMVEIFGKVIHGQKYGRKLGFPTANLDRRGYVRRKLKVKFGIYAGHVSTQHTAQSTKQCRAAIVIGPLDKNGLPKLEAHLINFKGNLYGKKITLSLGKFIRPFKKYKNEEELKKQIKNDLIIIKKILNGNE